MAGKQVVSRGLFLRSVATRVCSNRRAASLAQELPLRSPLGFWHRPQLSAFRSFSANAPSDNKPSSEGMEPLLVLPSDGFKILPQDGMFEEETLPNYDEEVYYPVKLGQAFQDRFQVRTKLGYGTTSTSWLARDLRDRRYVALKIRIHNFPFNRELPFYQHIEAQSAANKDPEERHVGEKNIRGLLETFDVDGPHGKHQVLVLEPASLSLLAALRLVFKNGMFEELAKTVMFYILPAVGFLHEEANAIHTDIQMSNVLFGLDDNELMREMEEREMTAPAPRKPLPSGRTIYLSGVMPVRRGPVLLSDFGEARLGPGPHKGLIMPTQLRAPEVLLEAPWSYPVDLWSIGVLAWELVEREVLFTARDPEGRTSVAAHFAEIIAAIGPPPKEFLEMNREFASIFWDEDGKWLDRSPIPENRSFEDLAKRLEGESRVLFLDFMRKTLTWMPDERMPCAELYDHPWLLHGGAEDE